MAAVLTLDLVAKLTGGKILRGDADLELSEIVIDSRGALPQSNLFVAITGPRFDGHRFINDAVSRGTSAALISKTDASDHPQGALIQVGDTKQALQQLAAGWRSLFDVPVIGVTGSNGKTLVKDMLCAIFGRDRTVYRSPGSYNSQIGVPLALLGLRPVHDLAVIEAGISQTGEMERLETMIAPTAGVITNIGLAHAAGLGTLETTACEKLKLFANLSGGPLVYPLDDPTLNHGALSGRPVPFCVRPEAPIAPDQQTPGYVVYAVHAHGSGFTFQLRYPDGTSHPLTLGSPGAHNVHNACAAAALAAELGMSVAAITEGLASFEPSGMRLEMHTTEEGITLINDAYNSDPVSARAALSALKHYSGGQRTIAILGDMLDLGALAEDAHRELGRVVAAVGIDRLICLGELAGLIGEEATSATTPGAMEPHRVRRCPDLAALHDLLRDELRTGDAVLFKASRSIGLERAAQRLLESVAPTRLVIDLDALSDNFHAIRRHIGPGAKIMAVVKSFGYGNDATRVSQTLIQQGVDALAVAYPDEAIPLRRRGVKLPILVTNVLEAETDKIVRYDLTALVYSWPVVEALQEQAQRLGLVVPVHLEIDTGMNRVGLKPSDAIDFARRLMPLPNIEITGAMTHLAAADDAAEDAFTEAQLAAFRDVLDGLRNLGISLATVHATNTAGTWRFPHARFDMVRVGLGLYGLHPGEAVAAVADNGGAAGTRPALRFVTRVIHVHDIQPGESVGYGRTFVAKSAHKLATIAAGYNDGFPRFMSNGGEVLIGGTRCPVVGNVCMDVSMVDITHLPQTTVGDEVVLFGTQGEAVLSVDEWATRGHTISYEILCNVSPRVRRIFVKA